MPPAPVDLLSLCVAALLIGLSKGGVGGALPPVLATLVLSERSSVAAAVALSTPLLTAGDAFALWTYWRRWDRVHVRALLPAGAVGVAIGVFLLRGLPDALLRLSLGIAGLVVVGYKLYTQWRGADSHVHRPWHAPLAGLLGGTSSAMLNAGGPPIAAYLLLQHLSPIAFTATNTAFFSVVNLLKVPGALAAGVIPPSALLWPIAACPLVAVGVAVGRRFILWVDPRVFDRLMTGILVVACVWLIVSS